MIFEEKFKDFKSLYLTVSGGSDSAIGLYLTCKYITENNLNSKVTIVTAVEPQTDYCPNFMNAKKVVSIIRDIFPKVNIDKHIIKFLEGYGRPSEEEIINGKRNFPKFKIMHDWHNQNWKDGDYDLGIGFVTSHPYNAELKKFPALYKKSLLIGPEDRTWTGRKNDKISPSKRGGHWWLPFQNHTKRELAEYYEKYNLMDSLFPYTASCTGTANKTKNYTEPCKKCYWCLEKYWAFGMFDYPQAYDL